MKIDSILSGIFAKIGLQRSISSAKAHKIISSYFSGVRVVIDEANTIRKPVAIKMDFFGKIIYNELARERKEEEIKKYRKRKDQSVEQNYLLLGKRHGTDNN